MRSEEDIRRRIKYLKSHPNYPAYCMNGMVDALVWVLEDKSEGDE